MHNVFFFTSRRCKTSAVRNSMQQVFVSTVQTRKDAGLILRLCLWSPPVGPPGFWRAALLSLTLREGPQRILWQNVLPAPSPTPSPPPEFHPPTRKSQSRDFDDVGSSWAGRGLDAWGGWAARRRRHPALPLRRPVEAIAVRRQSGRRWEADDGCGDAAAFTVDPVAVVSFQIEVWTTV